MPCPFCSCPTGTVDVERLRASLGGFGTWMPMSAIPKDKNGDPKPGEFLLLVKVRAGIPNKTLVGHWLPGGHCIEDHPPIERGWYFWNGSYFDKAAEPTHWMPLPKVPDAL